MQHYKKIYIEITNRCNLNCSFCNRTTKPPRTMSVQEFEIILQKIKDATDYIYLHVQGEPLLHPNLKELLEICNKYQKKVNIVTNGTLIKKATFLKDSPALRQVVFSLHSYKGNHLKEYIYPIFSATEALLQNDKIVSYRFWNEDLENQNEEIFESIKDYYHLDHLSFPCQKIKNNLYLNQGTSFTWPDINRDFYEEKGSCYGTRTHIAVLSDGTVVPCCLDKDGILALGNLFETDLKSIQQSKTYQKIFQGFQQNKKQELLCQHCDFIS